MPCFPARWTKSLAAAALLALPLTASAQTPDTKVDAAASKQHLSAARDTLSQLTSMPEAARLQGDARTHVSQVITSFNELITTQADWRSSYAKVDAGLTAVLGPDAPDPAPPATGVAGAVGTAGSAAATLDPAVRAKLVEFRTHLKAFEKAAGGRGSEVVTTAPAADPPAAAPPATAPPATAPPATAPPAAAVSEADKHLDAISAILDRSETGELTAAQTAALKKHVAELRALLNQPKKAGL
jgi:hypothetical protein